MLLQLNVLLQLNGVLVVVALCHIQNILLSSQVRIESESAAGNNQHLNAFAVAWCLNFGCTVPHSEYTAFESSAH